MYAQIMTLLVVMVTGVTGEVTDSSTTVNCASCQYVAWPNNAWECNVKCNVAPTGVLTYGKNFTLEFLSYLA